MGWGVPNKTEINKKKGNGKTGDGCKRGGIWEKGGGLGEKLNASLHEAEQKGILPTKITHKRASFQNLKSEYPRRRPGPEGAGQKKKKQQG